MPNDQSALRRVVTREVALFVILLFIGFVLMPIAIWFVGQNFFGDYGGVGYTEFFGRLSARIRSGDTVGWFLVLSPYLGIQTLRLMIWGWRQTGKLAA